MSFRSIFDAHPRSADPKAIPVCLGDLTTVVVNQIDQGIGATLRNPKADAGHALMRKNSHALFPKAIDDLV